MMRLVYTAMLYMLMILPLLALVSVPVQREPRGA